MKGKYFAVNEDVFDSLTDSRPAACAKSKTLAKRIANALNVYQVKRRKPAKTSFDVITRGKYAGHRKDCSVTRGYNICNCCAALDGRI